MCVSSFRSPYHVHHILHTTWLKTLPHVLCMCANINSSKEVAISACFSLPAGSDAATHRPGGFHSLSNQSGDKQKRNTFRVNKVSGEPFVWCKWTHFKWKQKDAVFRVFSRHKQDACRRAAIDKCHIDPAYAVLCSHFVYADTRVNRCSCDPVDHY